MLWLQMFIGGVAGALAGWLVWALAGRFATSYRASLPAAADSAPARRAGLPGDAAAAVAALALWGVYLGWQAPSRPVGGAALAATALLLCIALVDLRTRRIPNPLVLALLVCAALQVVLLEQPWTLAVLGLLAAGGMFWLLHLVGRGALGMGDVKLAAAIGALLGFPAALYGLLLGMVLAGLAAAFLLLSGRAGRKDPMAYGPYLVLGAWLVYTRALGLWPG